MKAHRGETVRPARCAAPSATRPSRVTPVPFFIHESGGDTLGLSCAVAQPSPVSAAASRSSSRSMRCQQVMQAGHKDPITHAPKRRSPTCRFEWQTGAISSKKVASSSARSSPASFPLAQASLGRQPVGGRSRHTETFADQLHWPSPDNKDERPTARSLCVISSARLPSIALVTATRSATIKSAAVRENLVLRSTTVRRCGR